MSEMETNPARSFKEVDVGTCVFQPRSSRFEVIRGERTFPPVAKWRMGLTALSQKFNLYFAVHGEDIHITVPQNVRQKIPGVPNLKLSLPRSIASRDVPGYISTADPLATPHFVNQLIVANLGDLEIIMVGCDDGDVLAYYTHLLDWEVREFQPVIMGSAFESLVKPMFHENVGVSAWGLAVHEKSRLLAVSSNAAEVTVFGFSLDSPYSPYYPMNAPPEERTYLSELLVSPTSQIFNPINECPASALHSRAAGYRMTLNLADRSSNIPAITFASRRDGEAEMILAVDILGNMWQLDLWKNENSAPPILRSYQPRADDNSLRSWSVLVLPLKTFRHIRRPIKALGVSDINNTISIHTFFENCSQCFDITTSKLITRDPTLTEPVELVPDNDDEGEDSPELDRLSLTPDDQSPSPITPSSLLGTMPTLPPKLQSGFPPNSLPLWLPSTTQCLPRNEMNDFRLLINGLVTPPPPNRYDFPDFDPDAPFIKDTSFFLPDGSAILRTYPFDIELLPPTRGIPPTICKDIFAKPHRNLPINVGLLDRLNMVTCIPELSLVIATSQAGDVALLTLTTLDPGFSDGGPVVLFRVDYTLPFANQRPPLVPLMGMAVSPVWSGPPDEDEMPGGRPRRWRMILHYVNHAILSYELWRDEDDALLAY